MKVVLDTNNIILTYYLCLLSFYNKHNTMLHKRTQRTKSQFMFSSSLSPGQRWSGHQQGQSQGQQEHRFLSPGSQRSFPRGSYVKLHILKVVCYDKLYQTTDLQGRSQSQNSQYPVADGDTQILTGIMSQHFLCFTNSTTSFHTSVSEVELFEKQSSNSK